MQVALYVFHSEMLYYVFASLTSLIYLYKQLQLSFALFTSTPKLLTYLNTTLPQVLASLIQ
jgi:hypothetical protein